MMLSKLLCPWRMLNIIFSMSSNKALGVDYLQPIFFKTYWDIVVEDVLYLVASAFGSG